MIVSLVVSETGEHICDLELEEYQIQILLEYAITNLLREHIEKFNIAKLEDN